MHARKRKSLVVVLVLSGLGLLLSLPPVHALLAISAAIIVSLLALAAPLASALLLPLYARLAPDELLHHPIRSRMVELVRDEPGLGISDVAARTHIGWGTAVHHLTRLERAGLLVSADSGRHRRFFLAAESSDRRTAVCVLSVRAHFRLVEFIRDHPGATQTETCAALGISPPLVHKYMSRLLRENLVTSIRQWRTVKYYGGPAMATTMSEFARGREASQVPAPNGQIGAERQPTLRAGATQLIPTEN